MAAAKVVEADYEKAIGVYGFAGAYALIPPTWLAILRTVKAGRVVVSAQGMADQHRIAVILVSVP